MSDKVKCIIFVDKLLTSKSMSLGTRTKLRICRAKLTTDRNIEDYDLLNVCEEAVRQQIKEIPDFEKLKGK